MGMTSFYKACADSSEVLPMSPVQSVNNLPGSYPLKGHEFTRAAQGDKNWGF